MKRPYFKFYVDDFRASRKVQRMTLAEIGAYLLLLNEASQTDDITLPDDDVELAEICGTTLEEFQQLKPKLKKCFVVKRKKWHNLKLQKVLAEYDRTVENNTKASSIAAKKRSKKISPNDDQTVTQPKPKPITKTNNQNHLKINNKSFFLNLKNDAEGTTNFVAPPATLVATDADDVAPNTDDANTPNYTPNDADDADDTYQTDNDAQLKTELLLADLQNSLAIPENIALQLGCNLYQATQMRNMFINHLRATGYQSANFSHLKAYCTNWCRSHAKTLLNTISQTPQTPRHG